MPALSPGSPAPALDLPALGGGRATLTPGRRAIVYFYPKAMTGGCTTEACDFQESLASLEGHGYDVVGVSPDGMEALEQFAQEQGLTFTLASDPGAVTAREWGAFGEKVKDGVVTEGLIRSTVVVDEDGTVLEAMYGVDAAGHVAQVRERLGIG
ncbi:peroxiredoxin [Actinotalea sp. Marseille-Q4924]|uniref:peroxiredoxin n=1 Tax=Actinotalea sp. Marseille-Q4924 TaxID=2866571 RepID=UPI001CE42A02|nr:peroxiredoxin [Actinotalea sp. Marseille-Q4924]